MPLLGDTMNLREYLFVKRMTIQEFSEIVDYSRVHISGIVNGKLRPSRKLAKRIEKETNGEVTIQELLKGE
jgi:transcriptional regulator with XRE-family HTH domain